jgi:hypothetical protein
MEKLARFPIYRIHDCFFLSISDVRDEHVSEQSPKAEEKGSQKACCPPEA